MHSFNSFKRNPSSANQGYFWVTVTYRRFMVALMFVYFDVISTVVVFMNVYMCSVQENPGYQVAYQY